MNQTANMNKAGGRARLLGIVLVISGVVCMLAPFVAGMAVLWLVGVVVVAAGATRMVWAFGASSVASGLGRLALGVLTVLCGIVLLANPVIASALLTLLLVAYFLIDGVSELAVAFAMRPVSGWGWMLFAGLTSILLGILLWRQFPLSGTVAVGVLLGFKLLIVGWAAVAIGSVVRSAA